ncbi:MAG: dihydroxyacetone kinase subunit DhaK, partial [Clostridiaceae bacterium]|nr:dihydroxyacetone kinase subunit DhaK [Clostridiaceae bacterium]
DDVASAPKVETNKRRGVAGIFFVYKVAGAMADSCASLDEVYRAAEKAVANVGTVGVALSPCIVPEIGKPSFVLDEDEMEIGMGIHGEPGIRRGKLEPVDNIVSEILPMILEDIAVEDGDEVSVLVNGLGATCKEELYIAFRKIAEILKSNNITLFSTYVGEYATSMEMGGFSISVLKLDEELKELLGKEANTPFYAQFKY